MNQAPLNKNRQDKFILVLNLPEGIKEIKDKVKMVKNSILFMKAVKALQEAMARIETLESEVTALKGG